MIQNGYLELTDQRNQLLLPIFDGVEAAKKRLHIINGQIANIEKDPRVFESSFIHKKPGYTKAMLKTLIVQTIHGSMTSELEIKKYADWVITQMSVRR